MGVIQLPVGRLRGHVAERSALRRGLARRPVHLRLVKLLPHEIADAARYCERCEDPILGGAIIQGRFVYRSVDCSTGEPPPVAG
jgi:hypothetical protein